MAKRWENPIENIEMDDDWGLFIKFMDTPPILAIENGHLQLIYSMKNADCPEFC